MIVSVGLAAAGGCQIQEVSTVQLEIHQSQVNLMGLCAVRQMPRLHVSCAPPDFWDQLPLDSNILYTHQQWRSPDHHVGMGVAYIHTPIPLSPQTLIWLAKSQYSSEDDGSGKLLGQWTDSLGRCWFEGENDEFHIRGYAMTRGHDAWMVYSGYRVRASAPISEILLAARGAESVALIPAHP